MLYGHVTLLMLRVVEVVSKTTVQQSPHMKSAVIPGDIQIGALFPEHQQRKEGCGIIWEQYGIQRTEIALKTIRDLNAILPFKLGITIRDSCWTERVAMEQAIAFLRGGVAQRPCCTTAGCDEETNAIVAVVGPAKSSTTIAVQNLLQVFRIPQIGYGATTPDLSDKEQYSYHMRVVPSDAFQSNAIIAILQKYKWRYVAVIYTAGNYGEKGFEELQKSTKDTDICIAFQHKVKSLADTEEFDRIINSIREVPGKLQVVVCFCEGRTIHNMFRAQQRLRQNDTSINRYQWIGSDGWADRPDVVKGVESEAAGSFSIRIHSPYVEEFDDYYRSLNPQNNLDNPWFAEFWEENYHCRLTVPTAKTKETYNGTGECSSNLSITDYIQDAKLSQVANAIRVVAYALRNMFHDKCPDNKTFCEEMKNVNGTILFKYMLNVTFIDQFGQEIYFDGNGDPPAWYDVLNYVGIEAGFQTVGDYRKKRTSGYRLEITKKVIFSHVTYFDYDENGRVPRSVCSDECGIGQKKSTTHGCCWTCDNCTDIQIVNYTVNECQTCVPGTWPDEHKTACYQLKGEALYWLEAKVICAWILALAGVITTTVTIVVFVQYNHTPVVKSTTRELSYIILGGIMTCYAVTFIILARPTFISCFLTRVIPPVGFSIIYSALLTKTNRIARILAGSKKRILTKKPRFLSTSAQVVITWLLVGVECVIVAVGVMEEMPQVGYIYKPRRMFVICSSTTAAFVSPFLWDLFLITLCTLYAVKTRNLPENFNEAKFIGFTMYCTLVIWIAFIVLHFNATNKALTMSFSFSISATVALIFLFFPKLYIIILHPEKNVRSSYTTTKLIRCHFGNSQGTDSKHISFSKTGSNQQSASSLTYPMRTASMRLNPTPSQDASTQTNSVSSPSRQGRTFSILRHRRNAKPLDDEILELIECCRRYQDAKAQSSTSNFVIEESHDDEVRSLLAGSIEQSVKTVLSAVARSGGDTGCSEFEELLKSRGLTAVDLSKPTNL